MICLLLCIFYSILFYKQIIKKRVLTFSLWVFFWFFIVKKSDNCTNNCQLVGILFYFVVCILICCIFVSVLSFNSKI